MSMSAAIKVQHQSGWNNKYEHDEEVNKTDETCGRHVESKGEDQSWVEFITDKGQVDMSK